MAIVKVPNYVHKVIKAEDLEWETESGWEYVEQIVEQVTIPVIDQVKMAVPTSGGGAYTMQDSVQRHVSERRVMFLVRRDVESVLAKLAGELAQEKRWHSEAVNQLDKEKEQVVSWQKQFDKVVEAKEEIADQRATAELAVGQLRDRVRIMEADLAKVATAIGSVRMKEILGR